MKRTDRFRILYNSLTIDAAHTHLMFAGGLLERAARLWAERTALLCDTEKITFGELFAKTVPLTHHLLQKGITPDHKILILYENSPRFYHAYYGAWQTGAVIVPVNTFLQPHELEHIITECEPAVILASEKLAPKIPEAFRDRLLEEKDIATLPEPSTAPTIPQKNPDELALLLYTSGTTGLPKGVMLSSRALLTNALQGACEFTISENERIYAALPLFHSYLQNCCLWSALIVGAATIIVPKIDRSSLLKGLKHNPTIVLGIPQLYGLFCMMRSVSFPYVKYFICGGDALPDKIRIAFELIFRRRLCNGYGLTETSPAISVQLEDTATNTNDVGRPVIHLTVEIRDENLHKTSGIGSIWVSGKNSMQGYYHAPEATSKILHDGWLNTGDLGMVEGTGHLVICGREKDLIINKGVKIYPQEVENVLMSHPEVTAAGVIGVEDRTTQVPVAFVAVKKTYPALEQELLTLCQERLARYKVPRAFYLETQLPQTATGKVDKKVLRAKLST